jgi:hypothetical protein
MLTLVPAGPVASRRRPGGFITMSREWEGEDAFLICGGASFKSVDVELLRGRRTVVINSSVYAVPFAKILFFADERWELNNRAAVKAFEGRVISASYGDVHCDYISFLRRPTPSKTPAGLSSDPGEVYLRHTSARGAINMLCHMGVRRIVTLGLDGGGASHHMPHPWGPVPGVFDRQIQELGGVVEPLRARGIELINASPGSRIPFWPIVKLEDVL